MQFLRMFVALVISSVACGAVQGHFIWLEVRREGGSRQACIYFGENPVAGEAHLIGKVAKTALVWRDAREASKPLALKVQTKDDVGLLRAELPQGNGRVLEAVCDYGVVTRDDSTFLLQYYAKHFEAAGQDVLAQLGKSPSQLLDVVPTLAGGKVRLQVLFQGQPLANAQIVLHDADGGQDEKTADEHGSLEVNIPASGMLAVRASHKQSDKAGQRDGKQYSQVRHYATLTMRLPAGATPAPTAAKGAADPAAEAVLAKARKARAVWRDFPGLRARVSVRIDGQAADGRAEVDSSGVVTLDMPDSTLKDWAERQLESLVQHRMPASDPDEHVTFVEEPGPHPLGRKLRLGDAQMDSHYRVQGNVITEVNRKMGEARMTISVLEVYRNAAGKYLPRIFAVNLWDEKTGALRSTTVASNEWKAVGKFDLPARVLEIYSANNKSQSRELLLSDVELIEAKR